jgi:hypothetical protein
METLMVAPLVMVTSMMMSPFPSTPIWVVDWISAQSVHSSQLLLPPHSLGIVSSGVGMIGVSSWSESSLA